MTKVLVIRSSANGANSVSNKLIDSYLAALPSGSTVVQRDLDKHPVPHVTHQSLAGIGRQAPRAAPSPRPARFRTRSSVKSSTPTCW
jgi:FMN-dependent NADH-azoreductase